MCWRVLVITFAVAIGDTADFIPLSPGDPFSPSPDQHSPLSGVTTPDFDGLICDGVTNQSRCEGCDILKCVEGSTEPQYDICGFDTYCGCPYEDVFVDCEEAVCLPGPCAAVELTKPLPNERWAATDTHIFRWHLRSRLAGYKMPSDLPLLIYMDDGHGGDFELIINESFSTNWAAWTIPSDHTLGNYRFSIQGGNDKDIYDMQYPIEIHSNVVVPVTGDSKGFSLMTVVYAIAAVAGVVVVVAVPYAYLSRKIDPGWGESFEEVDNPYKDVSDWSGSHITRKSSNRSADFFEYSPSSPPSPPKSKKLKESQKKKTKGTRSIRHSDIRKYLTLPTRMSVDSFDSHAGKDYRKFILSKRKENPKPIIPEAAPPEEPPLIIP